MPKKNTIKNEQPQQPFDLALLPLTQKPPSYKYGYLHQTRPPANCYITSCICTPGLLLWLIGMWRNGGCSPLDLHKKKTTKKNWWRRGPQSACCESTEQKSWQGHQSKNKTFETVVMFYGPADGGRDTEACFGFTGQWWVRTRVNCWVVKIHFVSGFWIKCTVCMMLQYGILNDLHTNAHKLR